MDALDGWNNLTPGNYTVYFTNDKTEIIPIERFIFPHAGGVVYMIDTYGRVYNWHNVVKLEKTSDL